MESIYAISIGLALRVVVHTVCARNTLAGSTIIGIWEGVALHHFTFDRPFSYDPYIACGVRFLLDLVYSGNILWAAVASLWTLITTVISDALAQPSWSSTPSFTNTHRSTQSRSRRPRTDSGLRPHAAIVQQPRQPPITVSRSAREPKRARIAVPSVIEQRTVHSVSYFVDESGKRRTITQVSHFLPTSPETPDNDATFSHPTVELAPRADTDLSEPVTEVPSELPHPTILPVWDRLTTPISPRPAMTHPTQVESTFPNVHTPLAREDSRTASPTYYTVPSPVLLVADQDRSFRVFRERADGAGLTSDSELTSVLVQLNDDVALQAPSDKSVVLTVQDPIPDPDRTPTLLITNLPVPCPDSPPLTTDNIRVSVETPTLLAAGLPAAAEPFLDSGRVVSEVDEGYSSDQRANSCHPKYDSHAAPGGHDDSLFHSPNEGAHHSFDGSNVANHDPLPNPLDVDLPREAEPILDPTLLNPSIAVKDLSTSGDTVALISDHITHVKQNDLVAVNSLLNNPPTDSAAITQVDQNMAADAISLVDSLETLTETESLISATDKTALTAKAQQCRQEAIQETERWHKLRQARLKALRDCQGRQALLLALEAKKASDNMDRLHKKAERRFFHANNHKRSIYTVDLHGLRVAEAVKRTENAIRDVYTSGGGRELSIIVGKGNHSLGGKAVLRPAVTRALDQAGFTTTIDFRNSGVIKIQIPAANTKESS